MIFKKIFEEIGKIGKKIVKGVARLVKKAAPVLAVAAAIYFTAGAALGAVSSTWATALGNFAASIKSTAIGATLWTSAKYAAIGGFTSAALGGSFQEGAAIGAVTGGIAGFAAGPEAISGAEGLFGDLKAGGRAIAEKLGIKLPGAEGVTAPGPQAPAGGASVGQTGLHPGIVETTPGPGAGNVGGEIAKSGGNVIKKTAEEAAKKKWYESPYVVGGALMGGGQALSAVGGAVASHEATKSAEEERKRLTASYENLPGFTPPGPLGGRGAWQPGRYSPTLDYYRRKSPDQVV